MTLPGPKRLTFKEREERLLVAAQRLFSQKGYRGTTTRAIAREAGINEALLFRHFPTKEALYDALLERAVEAWGRQVFSAMGELHEKSLSQALLETGRIIIQKIGADPSLLRMVTYASLEGHRLGQSFFKRRPPIKSLMESFFIERQKKGEIRQGDPAMMAATFLAMVFYYVHMKEFFGAERSYFGKETPTLEFFTNVFLEGVRP